jgi:hypothetical protein
LIMTLLLVFLAGQSAGVTTKKLALGDDEPKRVRKELSPEDQRTEGQLIREIKAKLTRRINVISRLLGATVVEVE